MFDKEEYDDDFVEALIEGLDKLVSDIDLQEEVRKVFGTKGVDDNYGEKV